MHKSSDKTYLFELSEDRHRLEQQSQFLETSTRQMIEIVGITAGMKVIDVGCGIGDVSFLLANFVGPDGVVVGVDRNPEMVRTARERAYTRAIPNVSFINDDVLTISLPDDFDAVVCRLVLVNMVDTQMGVTLLSRMRNHVRPGGILACQEADCSLPCVTSPRAPLFELAWGWVVEALKQKGIERQMSLKLHRLFLDAGWPMPEIRLEQVIGGGPNWGGYDHLAGLVRGLLPIITKEKIATEQDVAIDTLAQRLRDEVVSLEGIVTGVGFVSAWARNMG